MFSVNQFSLCHNRSRYMELSMENSGFYLQIHEFCLKRSLRGEKNKSDISQSIMYGNLSFHYIAMKDRPVERWLFS
jgi:hypothetical protein